MEIRYFPTTDQMTVEIAELLTAALGTSGTLMLSGGSTPYEAYNLIAQSPCPVAPGRRLFMSDERMVPANSPDNNAGNLAPMLAALECRDRFVPVDTGRPAPEAAAQFSRMLSELPPPDLGLLGIGSDGHTAGIFTPEQVLNPSVGQAFHTLRPDGMEGVTVSAAFIRSTERLILLVSGDSKKPILDTLLERPATIPAGMILSGHPHAEIWTDLDILA